MKIDKNKPSHWWYLTQLGISALLSLILRAFIKPTKTSIILYGHKLNGNLLALYNDSLHANNNTFHLYFLTMDPAYYEQLKDKPNILLAGKLPTIQRLAQTHCIISDHGLHSLILLLKFSPITFIDVWHGIPFKGFDADDFTLQKHYQEIWVTSRLLKQLYINQFKCHPEQIHETGYARTDPLINKNLNPLHLKKQLGITDHNKKIILFAPTWEQDVNNRNIFPFNSSEDSFLSAINTLADRLNIICIFRTHLNTVGTIKTDYKHIIHAPYSLFPEAEETLLISDILVCDWSSIAFDFLLLDRPTLFLDIPIPFKKGFSLDETYRFGHIITDLESLLYAIEHYIHTPESYWQTYGEKAQTIKQALYDHNADGQVTKRCFKRLNAL